MFFGSLEIKSVKNMLVLLLICQIIENTLLTGLIKRFNQQGKIVTWNLAQDEFHPDSDIGFDGIISIGLYIFYHGEQNSIHNSRKNF